MSVLGDRIKKYREDNQIRQVDFAKQLEIGRSTLSQLETGEIAGTLDSINKLSEITGKPISYWVGEDNDEDLDLYSFETLGVYLDHLHSKGTIKNDGKIPNSYKDKIISLLEMELQYRYVDEDNNKTS